MATWSGEFGSSPTWSYKLTATCTKRTSTQATIKVDLSLGLKIQSTTRFGYNYYWEPKIVGDSTSNGGWLKIKDVSPNWSDGVKRNFTYTGTVNVDALDKDVDIKISFKSTQISSASYTNPINKTLTIPTGNTAPTWSSDDSHIIVNGTALKSNIIIPENTGNVTVVVPKVTDAEGNSIKLSITRYANNTSQGVIKTATVSSGTSYTFTDSISSLGPGTAIKYTTSATDGTLSASSTRTTWVYTKNTFTKATVSNVGSIKYKSGFTFDVTNGRNQGGKCDGNCYYSLTSLTPGVTVYGAYTGSSTGPGTQTWTIGMDNDNGGRQATLKFNELKSALAGSKYKGSIKLRLTSRNNYGSSGYVDFTVNVDLTNGLPEVTGISYSGGTVTIGSSKYYCPVKASTVTVSFTGTTDPLGQTVAYGVYLIDGSNSILLGTPTLSNGKYTYAANLNTHIGNARKTGLKFAVKASTAYGASSTTNGSTFETYSYAEPTISITDIKRTGATATVKGSYTLGTDLPVTPTSLTYTITGGSATTYTLSGTGRNRTFDITINNLAEKAYTVTVQASDTYVVKSTSKTIPLADPMFSIRKNGVGVNAIPDGTHTLLVKGKTKITDSLTGTTAAFSGRITSNGLTLGNSTNGTIRHTKTDGATYSTLYITSNDNLRLGDATLPLWLYSSENPRVTIGESTYRLYHTGNKPTASEVGASPSNHNHDSTYLKLSGGTLTGQLTGWAPPTNGGTSLKAQTSGDGNAVGDGNTHIGLRSTDGKFYHYFRGTGATNIDTKGGLNVSNGDLTCSKSISSGYSIYVGKYEDTFRGAMFKRRSNNLNYEGRFGVSYVGSLKLTSESAAVMGYGAAIECYNADTTTAVRRYLFSQNSFIPMSDNNAYLGTSSHRWQSAYCTAGKFYTSTKSFKTNINYIEEPRVVFASTSTRALKSPKEYILEAIKDTPIAVYNYKSRMVNNPKSRNVTDNQMFVGFIADDLKANHPEFFDLIGEAGEHEREILDEEGNPTGETVKEMQYDISDISMLGVLWAGLQEALKEIDLLKQGGNTNV